MPRSLAKGRTKITILTTAPANPAAPTATELNAGIDISCTVLDSDFQWTATDSDRVQEGALCDVNNAESLGPSNFQGGVSLFRYFNATTGAPDATEDAAFAALDTKGTTLWGYARKTGKLSTAAWAATDPIYLGAEFATDEPQQPQDQGGWIKTRIPFLIQRAWPNIVVAT